MRSPCASAIRTLALAVAVAVAALAATSAPARAAHIDLERCHSADRACVIESSQTYLDALVSGDASHVRLAPQAWRVNGGSVSVHDEQEIRDGIETFECTTVAGIGHERWYVDEAQHQGIAFYDLWADPTRGSACDPPQLPRAAQVPAWIAERFRVLDGNIYDLEVVVSISAPGTTCTVPEPRDTDYGPAGCGNGSRECVIESASKYIDALLTHDASGVPLAPDAWRLENCINSGNDAATIRLGLEAPSQNSIVAVEHRRWFVDGENATILYVLWTHPSGDPSTPRDQWQATFITERFRVVNGLIKEIEAVFGTPGQPGAGPDYPDVDGDGWSHIDDNCPDTANPGQEDRGGLATPAPDGIGDACQCGDVSGNGQVNGQDATAIRRFALGADPNPLFAVPGNCDTNGSGACNGQDANAVKRAALGASTPTFRQDCPNANPSVPCPYCQ